MNMKLPYVFGSYLLSLALFAPASAQGQHGRGPGPLETELPDFTVVYPLDASSGYPRLEVMINGTGPYSMIFDTGASVTVLDKDFATELGLEVLGQTRIGDPTNPQALLVDRIAIPELSLGDAYFVGGRGVAWDRPLAMRRRLTRGILGLPTFSNCLVTLDYEKKEIRIEKGALPPVNGRDIIPIDVSTGSVQFEILIDGKPYPAVLDSGNPGNPMLPNSLMEKMDLVEGSTSKSQARMVNSTIEFTAARITNEFSIGPLTMDGSRVNFGSPTDRINFGRSLLDKVAITLDLEHGRMRIREHGQAEHQTPEALLARMVGEYEIQARMWPTPGSKALEFRGKASFSRSHGGQHLHETFELDRPRGEGTISGDTYISWRPQAERFELTQIDGFSPVTFWLTGQWDPQRERLALRSTPTSRVAPFDGELRWEYSYEANGTFIKEMLVPDGNGVFHVQSEYRYEPVGH